MNFRCVQRELLCQGMAIFFILVGESTNLKAQTLCLPTVQTTNASNVGSDSAILGGVVLNDGGNSVVLRGVCYGTSPNPNMGQERTENGSGTGTFTSTLRNLTGGTVYYARSYAKNSLGVVAYGNQVIFTTSAMSNFQCGTSVVMDVEGTSYSTVQIGTQCWMQTNLKTSSYRNGDPINTGLGNTAWGTATSGAYSFANNDPANISLYGKLYNQYAVLDPRGLCPTGWHVPSTADWSSLVTFLGGPSLAGGAMKSTRTLPIPGGWLAPNSGATNSSGFSALPGGMRTTGGGYSSPGIGGNWWHSSMSGSQGMYLYLDATTPTVVMSSFTSQANGFSVRCIQD